ncbi:MAG: ASCH domain-containing protein (plasmid) [Nodularia sp. CChRGM 3473]
MTTTIIKAISLHEPWASLIPMGLKKYETRSWATTYRGPLLICAAKKTSTYQELTHCYFLTKYQQRLTETDNYVDWDDLPFGRAIAFVDLTACIRMTPSFIKEQPQTELDTGDWRVGRFAWQLDNIRRIVPPIPITGRQGLFDAEIQLAENKLEAIA